MKKLLSMLLALSLVAVVAAGCGNGSKPGEEKPGDDKEPNTSQGYEIALITDKGNIDDRSFNQGSWEGVVSYAKANNKTHQYYKPEAYDDAGYLAAIELAVKGGAKVVVTPGFLFEVAIYEAQTLHPDVNFILLDGAPHTADYATFETKANVASVMYSEEQSGYLAGYAAVKDGYKSLGFMGGMAVPAVQAFGYGFLQGIEDAAKELNLADGSIKVTYHYTGNFEENDTNKATAATMYKEGTEIIFACGGSVGKSVMAAAAEADGKVIGVDVDQSADSNTVVTSATKGLGSSVEQVLDAYYNNKWSTYGGKTTYFSAANEGVALPDDFSRFKSFDKAAYDAIFAKLVDGSVAPVRTIEVAAENGYATNAELTKGLNLVKISVEAR